MVKKTIKQNVFLYKIWFYLYRKNRGVRISFFEPKTALYVDGYPRSGNTFLVHLVKNIFPDISMVHHFHAIAPIKIALTRGIPTYILLRAPAEAIASNYLKEYSMSPGGVPKSINKQLLGQLLSEYCYYYDYVHLNRKSLMLVDFKEVKEDFLPTLLNIHQRFAKEIDNEILKNQVQKQRAEFRGAVDTLGASTPNPKKEKLKKPLKEALIDLPDFSMAEKLYSRLTQGNK